MTKRFCEDCEAALQPDEIAESLTALSVLLCSRCLQEAINEGPSSPVQRR